MSVPRLRFKDHLGQDYPEWEAMRLGDILTFKNGVNATKEQYGHGIKFINVLDIINNDVITYENIIGAVNISPTEFEKNDVKFGDVLFQRSSETRDEVGQSNVYLGQRPVAFGGFVIRGRGKKSYNPQFMNAVLKTNCIRNEITQRSGGSTRYNIGQDSLSVIPILMPTIPEQTKIASFLTAVDEKISLLTKKCDLLTLYKKGVMQKIFSQELRFKDDDGRDFPEWEVVPFSKFLIPTLRPVNKPSENYLALGVRSHFKGTFQKPKSEPEKTDMDVLYQVAPGDLIVNITFAWEGAVAIAKHDDIGGLVSHRFPTYTFDEEIAIGKFFQYVYPTRHFKYQLELNSPGGAGRNRVLNKKGFLKIECLLPSVREQEKIANFLSAIDDKITATQSQLDTVKQYKQGLLQQMFV